MGAVTIAWCPFTSRMPFRYPGWIRVPTTFATMTREFSYEIFDRWSLWFPPESVRLTKLLVVMPLIGVTIRSDLVWIEVDAKQIVAHVFS